MNVQADGGHGRCAVVTAARWHAAAADRADGRRPTIMNISAAVYTPPGCDISVDGGSSACRVVAYTQLPVSALPEVDYPTIQVVTFYPGASPDVMSSSVTAPLERQFGQVPGLKQMTSTSSFGCSIITLQFGLDLNIDIAEQQVQAAINAGGTFLPRDLPNPPIYSKVNPADTPIMTLALDLDDIAAAEGRRSGGHDPGAEDFPVARSRTRPHQRRQKPGVRIRVNPTELASLGFGPRRRARSAGLGERRPGERKLRKRPPDLYDRRQRSDPVRRGLRTRSSSRIARVRRSVCRMSPTSSKMSKTPDRPHG